MFCTQCGNKVESGDIYCPHCGTKVGLEQTTRKIDSNTSVNISQNEDFTLFYASFWERFIAIFIDIVVLSLVVFTIVFGVLENPNENIYGLVNIIITALYMALMESSNWQATLGKKVMGIKVCDEHGVKIHFGKALLRNLSRTVSAITLMVGYFMMFWTKKSQTLHDMIAQTLVVKK